jgi:uncharacterized protein YbjT (DUF2867 family)
MSEVLITGATGDLGAALIPVLRAAGHTVRAMSRRPGGDSGVIGDLTTGDGLTDAVAGVDAVIHAASDPYGDPQATDVAGTRRLVEASAAAGVGHLLYVSIVGVDRNPYPYYRAKHEAERIVARSGTPYSVVRAAQFHEFIARLLEIRLRRGPVLFLPYGYSAQPLAAADCAAHLAGLLAAGPSSATTEFVGPERLTGREILRAWRLTGRRAGPTLPVWLRGDVGRAFRMQSNIGSPNAPHGQLGWTQWLREHPQGTDLVSQSHNAG